MAVTIVRLNEGWAERCATCGPFYSNGNKFLRAAHHLLRHCASAYNQKVSEDQNTAGMGAAGLDGHSLPPNPRRASRTPSSEYIMEAPKQSKRTRYSDGRVPSDPYIGMHESPRLAKNSAPSSRPLNVHVQQESSSKRSKGVSSDRHRYKHHSSSSRRLLREQSQRSYRSVGAGTSVGMGTLGREGPAGSGATYFGA